MGQSSQLFRLLSSALPLTTKSTEVDVIGLVTQVIKALRSDTRKLRREMSNVRHHLGAVDKRTRATEQNVKREVAAVQKQIGTIKAGKNCDQFCDFYYKASVPKFSA